MLPCIKMPKLCSFFILVCFDRALVMRKIPILCSMSCSLFYHFIYCFFRRFTVTVWWLSPFTTLSFFGMSFIKIISWKFDTSYLAKTTSLWLGVLCGLRHYVFSLLNACSIQPAYPLFYKSFSFITWSPKWHFVFFKLKCKEKNYL